MAPEKNMVHREGRIGRRMVVAFVGVVMGLVGAMGGTLYVLTGDSLERQMSHRMVSVAQLVAQGIDGDVVLRIHPQYRVYALLKDRLMRSKNLVGARRIFVFDREGRSLLDTQPDIPQGRLYPRLGLDRAELAAVWQGQPAHSVRFLGKDGVDYKSGYAPVLAGEQVVACVGVEMGVGFLETIRVFRQSVFFFGGTGAVITLGVGLALSRRVTRPVYRLVEAAREIGGGNLTRPLTGLSDDEIGYLGWTMEEMRKKILSRDEQLRRMLGGVAHEIRNPLGGIEMYAGLIAGDLPDDDSRKGHIQKVIGEVQTLNRVISEFLEFARPAPAQPEWVDLEKVVEEGLFLLGPEMEASEIRFQPDLEAGARAYADPGQLKQALVNLMKNAVQAMPEGGDLTLRTGREGEWVRLDVIDTGIGIAEADRDRLFEPFFTTREQGSGLGLAVVQQMIEENGGRVEVNSEVGRGTTFGLVLRGA